MCTSISGARSSAQASRTAYGVVRPGARVEHHRGALVGRRVQPAEHLVLRVGLPDLTSRPSSRPVCSHSVDQVGVRGDAVDVDLPGAQPAQVRPVEDVDGGHRATSAYAALEQRRRRARPECRAWPRPSSTTKRSVAARAFLSTRIAASRSGQASARYAGGQSQRVEDRAVPRGGAVVQPAGEPGQLGGEDQADRDRVAVPPAVALELLDRVAERVAVVEDLAQPRLAQVAADDVGLDPDRPLDQLAQHRRCADRPRRPGPPRSARGSPGRR